MQRRPTVSPSRSCRRPVPTGVGANRTTQAIARQLRRADVHDGAIEPIRAQRQRGHQHRCSNQPGPGDTQRQRPSPSQAAGVSTVTMQYGGLTGTAGSQAFIDDRNFAALESQMNPAANGGNGSPTQPTGQLVFRQLGRRRERPPSLLPTGASYCQCQFLQWGYWGGDLTSSNRPTRAAHRPRRHQHLGRRRSDAAAATSTR